MAIANAKAAALLPLAMAPIVAAILSNARIGSAFGLSGDFWAGMLMGTGIGLLVLMIAIGLRASRTS